MATINFPASPDDGDVHIFGGKIWQFNGKGWVVVLPTGPQGPVGNSVHVLGFFFDMPQVGDISPVIVLPYAANIVGWKLVTESSASDCEIDIWRAASAVPTSGDSIVASDPIDGQGFNSSTSMTGWSTSLSINDVLRARVNITGSATTILAQLTIVE